MPQHSCCQSRAQQLLATHQGWLQERPVPPIHVETCPLDSSPAVCSTRWPAAMPPCLPFAATRVTKKAGPWLLLRPPAPCCQGRRHPPPQRLQLQLLGFCSCSCSCSCGQCGPTASSCCPPTSCPLMPPASSCCCRHPAALMWPVWCAHPGAPARKPPVWCTHSHLPPTVHVRPFPPPVPLPPSSRSACPQAASVA